MTHRARLAVAAVVLALFAVVLGVCIHRDAGEDNPNDAPPPVLHLDEGGLRLAEAVRKRLQGAQLPLVAGAGRVELDRLGEARAGGKVAWQFPNQRLQDIDRARKLYRRGFVVVLALSQPHRVDLPLRGLRRIRPARSSQSWNGRQLMRLPAPLRMAITGR